MFNIEVDWPNSGLSRNFTGSAKLGVLKMLNASRRNCNERYSPFRNSRLIARSN